MDESAEWRLKYDDEVDKARKCFEELQAVCILYWFFVFLLSV